VRLLIDTNILIALVNEQSHQFAAAMGSALTETDAAVHLSVASLWEIIIKAPLESSISGCHPSFCRNLRKA
jgi:PIN domain nuclease of toxin-antitoxin system